MDRSQITSLMITPSKTIYIMDGYTYKTDDKEKDALFCTVDISCKAALINSNDSQIVLRGCHNHARSPLGRLFYITQLELVTKAGSSDWPLEMVYDDVMAARPELSDDLSFRMMKADMYNERLRCLPKISYSLPKFGEAIAGLPLYCDVFQGMVKHGDKCALVFSSRSLLRVLGGHPTSLVITTTSDVLPASPYASFMIVVHFRYENVLVPAVYCLVDGKSEELLFLIWKKLFNELVPTLEVTDIFCNFDQDFVVSLRLAFANCRVRGLWLSYAQMLCSKWLKLELHKVPLAVLGMAMAVPFLPIVMQRFGVTEMYEEAEKYFSETPRLESFLDYFDTWTNHADVTTLHGVSDPINTDAEQSMMRLIERLAAPGGNAYVLADNMRECMAEDELVLRRLQEGTPSEQEDCYEIRCRKMAVNSALQLYNSSRLSCENFLRTLFLPFNGTRSRLLASRDVKQPSGPNGLHFFDSYHDLQGRNSTGQSLVGQSEIGPSQSQVVLPSGVDQNRDEGGPSVSDTTLPVCTICLADPAECACVPCGQRVFCVECMQLPSVQDMKECPSCRLPISAIYRIY